MSSVVIPLLDTRDTQFDAKLRARLNSTEVKDETLTETVAAIIADIRSRGDEALVEYTNRFDRRSVGISDLEIGADKIRQALTEITPELLDALQQAAERIREYHQRQLMESWSYTDSDGTMLGQQVSALDRAGIYVPGGKAAYPSSVLMNAIPARVAGVEEIIMVVPTPDDECNPLVLAAASVAGVDRVFSIGGAQAVAALAYGTEQVPAVDKIVGPGNKYVAEAKRMVFGQVGIDMIAGPSEVLIYSDGSGEADWVAMDMFAQAEHDEDARSILICSDAAYIERVQQSIDQLLPEMERRSIIEQSLKNNACFILVDSTQKAVDLINHIAPEHLELALENAQDLVPAIKHAGAIFIGHHSAEVLGDYCAGPNHVLPTATTARFSSPLGVYDFQKRSSLIMCSDSSASTIAKTASVLARGEGLTAHARSAEYRIKD